MIGVTWTAAAMHLSLAVGHPVEACRFLWRRHRHRQPAFLFCAREYLDATLLVIEEEIRDAMQFLFYED
ncbi:MAG: hypothetical protein R3D59_05650 [Paracoccaceae bacterium]